MRLRIVAKGAYYLCRVRLSARISMVPTGRISIKFDTGGLMKICWESADIVEIGQKYIVLYVKT
jgi:hypothetical protein